MVERLTVYDEYAHIGRGGIAHRQCREKCTTGMTCATCSLEEDMLKRLAAYEDLGPVEELAALKEAAERIVLMWDNGYIEPYSADVKDYIENMRKAIKEDDHDESGN